MADQKPADAGMIEQFKNKVRAWWADVERLRKTPVPKAHQAAKQKLLDRAETIKNTIKKATNWSDTLRINELGFAPLIPVAVIGGAVAAMGYWAVDYGKFVKTLAYQRDLVAQGVAPERAAAIAGEQASAGGMFSGLQGTLKLIMFAGTAYVIYRFVVKRA